MKSTKEAQSISEKSEPFFTPFRAVVELFEVNQKSADTLSDAIATSFQGVTEACLWQVQFLASTTQNAMELWDNMTFKRDAGDNVKNHVEQFMSAYNLGTHVLQQAMNPAKEGGEARSPKSVKKLSVDTIEAANGAHKPKARVAA